MCVYETKQVEGILLYANESPYTYSNKVKDKILLAMQKMAFHRYPQDPATTLNEAYANYVQLASEQVISGNGSDEMLGLMIALFIKKDGKLYTLSPDFSMYDYYVSLQDGKMLKYQNEAEDIFDVDAFIKKGKDEKVAMIVFSNPNNPTGKVIETKNIIKIVEAFSDIPVIVDEAYGEFYEESMIPYVNTYENLYVTRTLSKAFASAGIRCGFLMGNKKSMQAIAKYKVPYNVNSMTQAIAKIVIEAKAEMLENVAKICLERDRVFNTFKKMQKENIVLYPSKANYLYGKCNDLAKLKMDMETKNIEIRYYRNNDFRITIGKKVENDLVLEVLKNY